MMKPPEVVKAPHLCTTREAQIFPTSVIAPKSKNTAAIPPGVAPVSSVNNGPTNAMTTSWPAARGR
jgi:hypothetical protein